MNRDHETKHTQATTKEPITYSIGGKEPQGSHLSGRGEKRPAKISGWREDKMRTGRFVQAISPGQLASTIAVSIWRRGRVFLISTIERADYPDGKGDGGPQWHISISASGERPTEKECRQALACFDLSDAEKDNHHPGSAEHFWLPIDPARRVECECKTTEEIVVEPDGYTWSHAEGDTGCCDVARLRGVPCPVHAVSG